MYSLTEFGLLNVQGDIFHTYSLLEHIPTFMLTTEIIKKEFSVASCNLKIISTRVVNKVYYKLSTFISVDINILTP